MWNGISKAGSAMPPTEATVMTSSSKNGEDMKCDSRDMLAYRYTQRETRNRRTKTCGVDT